MECKWWKNPKTAISSQYRGAIPGLTLLGLVILTRWLGGLQPLEWATLDLALRLRPSEPMDERITLIGINEDDIKRTGTYPIPDRTLAQLITTLQNYQPRAIGFDIVRDLPVEPGKAELAQILKTNPNLYGIEKALEPKPFAPPPNLPLERVGFSDAIPDADGHYRRSLLGLPIAQGYQFALFLRLAEAYLAPEGIVLDNGLGDRETMRFNKAEIPRFMPNTGGYIRTDAGGLQTLLNYRNGKMPFRVLSLGDIQNGNFQPEWIRDRLVLIGITVSSVPDLVNTLAVGHSELPGQIFGVEYQAHAASQILSAVQDGRPLLRTGAEGWEYLWIVGWGILAIYIGHLTQSLWKNLGAIALLSLGIFAIGYGAILMGWWLPLAPVLLIFAINGVGLSAFAFYQRDRGLRLQLQANQTAIDLAFSAIHNHPLQQLAVLSRSLEAEALSSAQLREQLQALNNDIRDIFDHLKQDALSADKSLRLDGELTLDLDSPLSELFYCIYRHVLKRDYPHFKTLKVPILDFQPITPERLTLAQKRQLCSFLEESLCNAGKYAEGMTRLNAIGRQIDRHYCLTIEDNGSGLLANTEGQGTKNAQKLARQLGGKFNREAIAPQGMRCRLTWLLFRPTVLDLAKIVWIKSKNLVFNPHDR